MSIESRQATFNCLAMVLSIFKDYVAIQNGACFFDSNRLAESLMADVLSLIGDWGKLENLNDVRPNHPAIDLIDKRGLIGVQVTSTRTLTKITSTIGRFIKLQRPPKELYILMICGQEGSYYQKAIDNAIGSSGLNFNPKTHILDTTSLLQMASKRKVAQVEKAVRRLEEELGSRAIALLSRFNASGDRALRIF